MNSRTRCRIPLPEWIAAAVLVLALFATGCGPAARPTPAEANLPAGWPPKVGDFYPKLELRNADGEPVSLSSFRGQVLLIEMVGMTCPACNAFSGGGNNGVAGFEGVVPQADLRPIEEYVETYGGVAIDDPRLTFIQILLYNMELKAPSSTDARAWLRHFQVDEHANYVLLYGGESLVHPTTYRMIPGFQLVDREGVLRCDSTGHRPRHNLYTELLPALGKMLAGDASGCRAGSVS